MIVTNAAQGTTEWVRARLGIPTASQYHRIMTPKKRQYAAGASTYRNELLAEWLLGRPLEDGSSGWMDRGTEMEAEARRWYAFDRDVEVVECGFVLRDDSATGGSPDGLVSTDGGVEIKVPAAKTHVGYLLDPKSLVEEYGSQVQGYMYLTGRQWFDVVSYNPVLPSVVERVERDDVHCQALELVLASFTADLDECKERLAQHRVTPPSLEQIIEDYRRFAGTL